MPLATPTRSPRARLRGALLFVLGVGLSALPADARPDAARPAPAAAANRGAARPRTRAAGADRVDCKRLEKWLRACTAEVIVAADPAAGPRLARMSVPLRRAVLQTTAEELVSRAVVPCEQRRGTLPQARPVAECLARATGKAPCQAFGACLSQAFATLPPPRPRARKAPPDRRAAPRAAAESRRPARSRAGAPTPRRR